MKKTLALFALVLAVGMTAALDAEAKRLGGGKSSGMQRQSVTAPAKTTPGAAPGTPAQTAPTAGTAATAGAAAAPAKRSWMGPIAGLAAGLGLAALASHFGFGEALANVMTMALIAMAVLFVVGLVMRKRAGVQGAALAGAGGVGPFGNTQRREEPQPLAYHQQADTAPQATGGSMIGSRLGGGLAGAETRVGQIPAGFDAANFERVAREQFLALQAANDARDLERLHDYLAPEMFEAVREEIVERGTVPQKTDVFGLQAQVLDVAEEGDRHVVSVRFTGSVREQPGAMPEDLDEVWHLTKPRSGAGGWVIAGIQQVA
ncbi:MAG: Tim44 domain-containing protein [Burkholderiales bacterium]|nr:Tim44 domain-containing protein [Burkholderiales bacterium]